MSGEDSRYSRYSTISADTDYKDNPYRNSIPISLINQKQNVKNNSKLKGYPFNGALYWESLREDADNEEDGLHTFDSRYRKHDHAGFYPFSARGWLNFGLIAVLIGALLMLFAGYPILTHFRDLNNPPMEGSYNLGGINATGQVPVLPGVRGLVDEDTPENAKHRKGFVGDVFIRKLLLKPTIFFLNRMVKTTS